MATEALLSPPAVWLTEAVIKAVAGGATTVLLQWFFKQRGQGDKPQISKQTLDALYPKIAAELSPSSWKILEKMKTDDVPDYTSIELLYGHDSITEPLKHEFRYRLKYLMLLGIVTQGAGLDEYTCTNLGIEILNERDRLRAAVRGGI